MMPAIQALKARIETFEHIIAICDDNPVGSRQLIGGELMGMRKALELFEPIKPYVDPRDGEISDFINNDQGLTAQYRTMMNIAEHEREGEKAAPPSNVETSMEEINRRFAERIEAVTIPSVPKAPTQKERILAAYHDGHTTGAEIANATGIKRGSVDAVLSVLRKEGEIAAPRAIPAAGSAEVPAKPRAPF